MKLAWEELVSVAVMAAVLGLVVGAYLTLPSPSWGHVAFSVVVIFAGTLFSGISLVASSGKLPSRDDKVMGLLIYLIVLTVLLLVLHAVVVLESVLSNTVFGTTLGSGVSWQWILILLVDFALSWGVRGLWGSSGVSGGIFGIVMVIITILTWIFLIPSFTPRPVEMERIISAILTIGIFIWMYASASRENSRIGQSYKAAVR